MDLKRAILFLHGTTGDFRERDFVVLRDLVEARYEMLNYRFYEDRGNAIVGDSRFTCEADGQRPLPAFDSAVFSAHGLEPDQPDPPPGICDSNDSIELNSVLLDADIAVLLEEFDRVTLVSNSGGAAIVRGYLAYAAAAETGTLRGVDLSVSLEGVQAGTYLASLLSGAAVVRPDQPISSWVRHLFWSTVKPALLHDPRRPAFKDVTPGGDFQRFVARAEAIPNEPHYLNVAGDLVVNVRHFLLFWEFRDPDVIEVGDFVMLPGLDDPAEPHRLGGARFLPSSIDRGQSSGQWILSREFDVTADAFSRFSQRSALLTGLALAAADPAAHQNLSRMDEICVRAPSPAGSSVKRLHAALFDAIASLDRGVHDPLRLGFGNLPRVSCP